MHQKSRLLIEGLLAGAALTEAIIIYKLRKPQGVLKIDRKTDKDLYRFEIDDLDSLANKKFVVLKIDNNADLSQH